MGQRKRGKWMMTVWQQQFQTKRDTFLKDKIVEIEYFTLKM